MIVLQLLPVVLSLMILGAHFLRAGSVVMVAVVVVLLSMLCVRRRWAARTVQVALVLGMVEWGRTLMTLASARAENGEPLLRMALILGSVALVTGLSTLVFRAARVRSWYHDNQTRVSVGGEQA